MRQSSTLSLSRLYPRTASLCRLPSASAGRRTFPAFSLRIALGVLGPLPRRLPWCMYPFLPTGQRPSPHAELVGAPQPPYPGTFRMEPLSRLQSCADVQARRFARHPGCSYHRASWHQAAMAFPSTPLSVCYLPGIPVKRDISYHQSLSAIADWRLRARGSSSMWDNTVSNRSGNSRRKNREAGVDPSEARQSKVCRALHTW
jgi:hypothetical protein